MLSFWKKLKEQFDETAGPSPSAANHTANPLLELLEPLEAARKAALGADLDARREAELLARRQAALAEEEARIRQHRQEMFDDIVDLHKKLGTGFDRHQLEQMATDLKASLEHFAHRQSDSLADRSLRAILATVEADALGRAWDSLEVKLAEADLAWPAPPGISPNATPEEVERKTQLHTAILHEDFLKYDLKILAALIEGAVPAWRSVYPERNSSVWTATVYQAVGGAYAARNHKELMEVGQAKLEELREKIAERLEPALAPITAELKKGVESLSQALRLSEEANRTGEKVALEVFWDTVRPGH